MNNTNILRKIVPFLIVFVVSVGFGLYSFADNFSLPTQAADGYEIDIVNVNAPIDGNEWSWNVLSFVQDSALENIELTYRVYWCHDTNTSAGRCVPSQEDFNVQSTIDTGIIPIRSRDSVTQVRHQGANCGRVGIHILDGDEEVGFGEKNTHISCSDIAFNLQNSFSSNSFNQEPNNSFVSGYFNNIVNKVDELIHISGFAEYHSDPPLPGTPQPAIPPDPNTPNPEPVNPNPREPGPPPNPVDTPPQQSKITAQTVAEGKLFYDRLSQVCSVVNRGNYASCLRRVQEDGIQNVNVAKDWIKLAVEALAERGYPDLQCIGFTRAIYGIFLGRIFDISFTSNYRVAKNLSPNIDSFTYYDRNDSPPMVGDIVKWSNDPDGHVAVIVSVVGDEFEIIQANVGYDQDRKVSFACKGCLSQRGAYRFESDLEGFYRIE